MRHRDGRFSENHHDEAVSLTSRLEDSDEFVLNRYPGSDPSPQDIENVRSTVTDLISRWEEEPDWLPDIQKDDDGEGDEDDGYIDKVADLTDPEIAAGNCVRASEAFQVWGRHVGERFDVVQGMREANGMLSCHYANVILSEGGQPVVVDFTFSQVDETAEFPLICSPEEWVSRIERGF